MGKGIVKLGEGDWAVKDGNLLAAKETNGRFKNTEFTVTRGTDATYVGKDGLIKDASFYNLLPHSEDFTTWTVNAATTVYSNTTETLSPTNTYSASKITSDGSNGLYKAVAFGGGNNTKSIYLKGIVGGEQVILRDPAQTIEQKTLTLTTDWVRYELTENQTSTIGLWINEIPSNGIYMWGGQLVEGTEALDYQYTNGKEGIPRIDFTDNTDGHLLLEPQSKNLVTYSEDFSQWSNVYAILNANQPSPDGFNNAFIVEDENATAYRKIDETITTNATPHTFSVFIKKKTSAVSSYSGIQMGVGFSYVVFDSFNGTYHEQSNTNYDNVEVQDFNSNWWRLKLTATVTTSTRVALWGAISTSATNINNGATGSETFYGAQLEELSYATSYIPTNGSQVTRDAETCTGAGSSADFNSEEGVLYLEVAALADDTSQQIGVYGGSITEQLRIEIANSVIKAQLFNGSYQANMSSTQTVTNFNKVGFKWKVNDFALWINGTEVVTDNSGTTFSAATLDNINFSAQNGTSSAAQAKVKALKVYKETDGIDLATLTSL